MVNTHHQFVRVEFARFKVFDTFSIHLRHFNILVGPNNSGSPVDKAFENAVHPAQANRPG
jgi:hypothetical protein